MTNNMTPEDVKKLILPAVAFVILLLRVQSEKDKTKKIKKPRKPTIYDEWKKLQQGANLNELTETTHEVSKLFNSEPIKIKTVLFAKVEAKACHIFS